MMTTALQQTPKKVASSTSPLNPNYIDVNDINKQSRFWCFTVNNYVCQYSEMPKGVTYLVSGQEVGDAGTPHLQCYVELERGQRRSFVSKLFPGAARIAIRWSDAQKASDYCKKDGNFVEFGELSSIVKKPGKRNDLQEIADKIKAGVDISQIQLEHQTTYMRNYRGIQHYRNVIHKPLVHRPNLRVHLFIGKTRLGKSHHARVTLGAWPKPVGKGLWFDGYDREKTVVIDEFRGQFPLSDVLQITDPYQVAVETKGGHTWFEPDLLIFTTNISPMAMYTEHDAESREAFFARFHKVFWWYAKQQFMELTAEQQSKLFQDGTYPHIPITTPTSVRPSHLDGKQPSPPKLKRCRTSTNLAKELLASNSKPPAYRMDHKSGKLVRPLKQLKVINLKEVPETQLHKAQEINLVEPSCDEDDPIEFTQDTQVIQAEDDSTSDEVVVPDTQVPWQEMETQQDHWNSDDDLFEEESSVSGLMSEEDSACDSELSTD